MLQPNDVLPATINVENLNRSHGHYMHTTYMSRFVVVNLIVINWNLESSLNYRVLEDIWSNENLYSSTLDLV